MVEKSEGNECPRCLTKTLNTYYSEKSGLNLGAKCGTCSLTGFYIGDRLVPVKG